MKNFIYDFKKAWKEDDPILLAYGFGFSFLILELFIFGIILFGDVNL